MYAIFKLYIYIYIVKILLGTNANKWLSARTNANKWLSARNFITQSN